MAIPLIVVKTQWYPKGARHTTSLEFTSAIPYHSQPPSLSSAERVSSNHFGTKGGLF